MHVPKLNWISISRNYEWRWQRRQMIDIGTTMENANIELLKAAK